MTSQEEKKNELSNFNSSVPHTVNTKCKLYPVSKIREALPQILAVSAKNLLLLTFGTSLGFATILIPELQKFNPEISVTVEEITWIGSINLFLLPVGGFLSGLVSQRFGRRRTMMISTIPFAIAWIIFYYATNTNMILVAQALTGLTGGLLEAPVVTYVAEITQPHLRGMLSATSTMAVMCGVFTQMLSGSFVKWRTVAIINLLYPLLSFTALYFVPESPSWLADQGRFQEAENGLCWLRGWVTPKHIESEFHNLCLTFQIFINATTIKSISLENKKYAKKQTNRKIWLSYFNRKFYIPFFVVSLIFFINAFGGIMVLQVFAVMILDELNTPIDKYQGTVIIGTAQVIGTIICVIIIHFTGKRKLTFFSMSSTGMSLLLISVYGYLIMYDLINSFNYTWIPTSFMIGAAFFSHMGLKMLPWILAGEVFAPDVRSIATGAAGSIGYIFSSIANKIFIYMKNEITLPGTFLFYAVVNFAGVIGLYFILPETEGRTLKEIESYFAGLHQSKIKLKRTFTFRKIKEEETKL